MLGCQDKSPNPAAEAETVDLPRVQGGARRLLKTGEYDLNDDPGSTTGLGEHRLGAGQKLDYKGRVFQPSGNANRWTWSLEFYGLPSEEHPYYVGPDYTMLGLESGDVWTH